MAVEIHLLGSPRIVRDGAAAQAPRGRKIWGLLAYLLLREMPPSRTHVAYLLFPAADDPLASLRWTLSILRRLLGEEAVLQGDPLTIRWVRPPVIDVLHARSARTVAVDAFNGLERELLESMRFPGCPSFEIWLEAERRHARGAAEALLHEAALTRLARGDFDVSSDLASRLVALNPYDENHQALLVRALASGGRGIDAARQAAAARELFRSELGVDPGPALAAAAATMTSAPTRTAATGRPAVLALLDAGEAAIVAGVLEAGLQCLRRAVAESQVLGDSALQARAFTALGAALVHAARGGDEEGVTSLHRALMCNGAQPSTLAQALNELAYVELLRGRYDRVEIWLGQAEALEPSPDQQAMTLAVRGTTLSDQGRYPQALVALQRGRDVATTDRRRAYLLGMIGRVHVLRGEHDQAAEALKESLARATSAGWTTYVPWPESLRAEVDLQRGDLGAALAQFEHAFALGCQIGDPCWEGMAGRGLGLVRAAKGDVDSGVQTLLDAKRRASRLPDGYVWTQAYVLDALATIGVDADLPQSRAWIAELAAVAGYSGMAELNVRAALHQWRLGDPAALDAARSLAEPIDNPALTALLT